MLQLVKQGRYPYQNWFRQWSQEDEEKVQNALEATGLADLADRQVDSLSGGQRQRAVDCYDISTRYGYYFT